MSSYVIICGSYFVVESGYRRRYCDCSVGGGRVCGSGDKRRPAMRLRVKKCIHLMVILLALIETFTGAIIDCVIYTIFYPTSLGHDAAATSDYYFTAYLLPTKHFYRLIIVLYVPILYLWRSHGVGRLAEGSPSGSEYGHSTVFGVICTRFPRRILPATAEWLWYWLRALQSVNAGIPLANDADCNWQTARECVWYESEKSWSELDIHRVQRQHNSVIRQYNTRVCCIHFPCFLPINLLSVRLYSIYLCQRSRAPIDQPFS